LISKGQRLVIGADAAARLFSLYRIEYCSTGRVGGFRFRPTGLHRDLTNPLVMVRVAGGLARAPATIRRKRAWRSARPVQIVGAARTVAGFFGCVNLW
jgi:hypothetical protein